MIQEMDPPSPFRLESFGNMSRQVEHAIQEQQQRMQHAHRRVDDAGGRIRQLENERREIEAQISHFHAADKRSEKEQQLVLEALKEQTQEAAAKTAELEAECKGFEERVEQDRLAYVKQLYGNALSFDKKRRALFDETDSEHTGLQLELVKKLENVNRLTGEVLRLVNRGETQNLSAPDAPYCKWTALDEIAQEWTTLRQME
ncbi:hypothetical protein EMIHUDRAFT_361428 [Emiliania huxleyi CCMP1516]|uniref:Uncharacterized protein n=2 Tax=Emiliania huxleyi TaxID=2903 RepID=A0A0D3KT92_EMIH1|nr:hypothetical protein EMIHUDRAFT_440393 [Emiliania huxleyi CCMP1516]XP_005791406.1 hypothetical protein EMIHUDRAFT_361428 [Emiliania huxleyi CCMP1516]EOD37415.1 hypothetical protein EMIHUDRAFT_440393 [Emiliania huxleyi CCMP1516]EOD38977.1 hypothetical protein EMIHUDRAFT_361428 [Emiliania huxleyi CCMP1516]|eukprot:XP_005789844.1 hypothetical protein EMIHUDRAFT_440393 [Emiliania huxleyi CCMP1516]